MRHNTFRWFAVAVMLVSGWLGAHASEVERTVRQVQFSKGSLETRLQGSIKGYQMVDYQMRAGAGQTLTIALKGNNSTYFNLLPPGSTDAAMAMGERIDNRFEGRLPDDGLYTIRVYQVRAVARRGVSSTFELSVGVSGAPLRAVSAKQDAVLPGTPFHARSTAPCAPAYAPAQDCETWVKRRGFDGTATVELRWKTDGGTAAKRRVLFVKGEPVVADVPTPLQFERTPRGWNLRFDDERFEVPEPLVMGG